MTAARSDARRPLLFYVASAEDPQRRGLGPALAGAAERAGWEFESYYDALRKGRHFGGGDPDAAAAGWPNGGLVAGARHLDQVLWLASAFEIVACGDPSSPLWPTLEACGAEVLARTSDPVDIYAAVFERLELPLPATVLVLDGSPQGRGNVVAAPYLYPPSWRRKGRSQSTSRATSSFGAASSCSAPASFAASSSTHGGERRFPAGSTPSKGASTSFR